MPSGPLTVTHLGEKSRKRGKILTQRQMDEYDRVQRLIEEVQVDLVNGVLRSEITRKFNDRIYENLKEGVNIGDRQISNYIRAAWELIKEDRIEKRNELRDLLFSQYMAQYNEATECGNVIAAKGILDSIAKVFLGDEKQNANIQVTDKNGEKIKISFGFSNNEEVDGGTI